MTETKFTPGPWRIATKGNYSNLIEAYRGGEVDTLDDGYRPIGSFQSCVASRLWDDEQENARANGLLMAAAPELFEAVRYARLTAVTREAAAIYDAAVSKALGNGGE